MCLFVAGPNRIDFESIRRLKSEQIGRLLPLM
jgi:hypothetical protein